MKKSFALLLFCASALVARAQYSIPYAEHFDSQANYKEYTVVDANGDNAKWQYDNISLCALFSQMYKAEDDWFISPAISLVQGKTYELSFSTTSSDDPQTISVCLGASATVAGMTEVLLDKAEIPVAQQTHSARFVATKTGGYYIGFHLNTEDKTLFTTVQLDDVSLVETAADEAPAAISDLTITPADKGVLSTTICLTAPDTQRNGAAQTSPMNIVIQRDGQEVLKQTDVEPGKQVRFTDTPSHSGLYTYKAIATSQSGSSDAANDTVYVGVDTPCAPIRVDVKYVDDTATVSWPQADSKGEHGGYVDPSKVSYKVVRARQVPGSYSTVTATLTKGQSETQLTDTPEKPELGAYYYYRVYSINEMGTSSYNRSDGIVVADVATLPYAESWSGAQPHTFWTEEHDQSSRWCIMEAGDKFTQDKDGGFAGFTPYLAGEWSRWLSGPISLAGAAEPVLSFWYYCTEMQQDFFALGISVDDSEWKLVKQFDLTQSENVGQWIQVEIPLKEYLSASHIQLEFEAQSTSTVSILYIDNITIEDHCQHNLAAVGITTPRKLKVGRSDEISLSVKNLGQQAVNSDYQLALYADDRQVGTAQGVALEPGEQGSISFTIVPDNHWLASTTLRGVVLYAEDETLHDNQTEYVIGVTLPSWPVPTNLTISDNQLSWQAPAEPRQTDQQVTDDFESYADFTIKNFGDWTLLDGDMTGVYSAGVYPNCNQAQAFQIFNPSAAQLSTGGVDWTTHSGSKFAIAFASPNDPSENWLISPELSGNAQTISFWARALDPGVEESYSILCAEGFDDEYLEAASGTVTAEWTQITAEIPAGYHYFAIQHNTESGRAFAVDDVTFVPDTLAAQPVTLTAYRVYCNDELLCEVPAGTTSCTLKDGLHGSYTVAAVYDLGESLPSEICIATAVNSVLETSKTARFYSISGQRLQHKPHGLYISGHKTHIGR